ncbi:MAG TPA: peptide-methionine (S)-S-oxide reductase MsrA [Egibacteraceae bacterium]|nr:peptide-methionine (S)-S-oxide reductase MsrA [Egibacteraceae bacterium]
MSDRHAVLGTPMHPPFPEGLERAVFGMGCFWGAEELYWQVDGVFTTAVGYAGGETAGPSYELVCTGRTGHAEVVLVVFDPARVSYAELLKMFWEQHDPTQGMRQGNDIGTQYRSLIQVHSAEQRRTAEASRDAYQQALNKAGRGAITTEITGATEFWYAEPSHQQYLAKNPHGYRCHARTDVPFPAGVGS